MPTFVPTVRRDTRTQILLAVSGHCNALTGAIIDVNGASYLR